MKRLLAAYRLWRTERALRALSDHMLRDIGLRRDQLSEFLQDLKKQRPGFPGR